MFYVFGGFPKITLLRASFFTPIPWPPLLRTIKNYLLKFEMASPCLFLFGFLLAYIHLISFGSLSHGFLLAYIHLDFFWFTFTWLSFDSLSFGFHLVHFHMAFIWLSLRCAHTLIFYTTEAKF